ncbi:hypothetical protein Agub_g4245 [Astrephomene gubernaculifera]|uniref:Uncharacterized protein n=1 Tax=Astrephomene gubernaculifera TaxID=47775 RepID=A0AAD3HJ30_9CHLO|nr:hypothetical protein Agub_g4243 [Astrephomene gubernaculifera]GFR43205.1 hypothetical protein Agub_g4245 [Astrephomene gubernaculifera]
MMLLPILAFISWCFAADAATSCSFDSPINGCSFNWTTFAAENFPNSALHASIAGVRANTQECLVHAKGSVFVPHVSDMDISTLRAAGDVARFCPSAGCKLYKIQDPRLLDPYGMSVFLPCVSSSAPSSVADFFLSDGDCANDALAKRQNEQGKIVDMTNQDVLETMWWTSACLNRTSTTKRVFAAILAPVLGDSPARVYNALSDFLSASDLCMDSAAFNVSCSERLLGLHPPNSTSCDAQDVNDLEGCCGLQDTLNGANLGVSGRLPSDFTLARNRTNLSDNPQLCGLVSTMSPRSRLSNSPPPYVELYNSKVQLDLPALQDQYPRYALHVISWLGNCSLTRDNLAVKPLDDATGVLACALLKYNGLTIQAPLADPSIAVRHPYQQLLVIHMDNDNQARALEEYNAFVKLVSTGLLCGPSGELYRAVKVVITFACAFGAAAVWTFISRCTGWLWAQCAAGRSPLWNAVLFIVDVGPLLYDEVSDWLFVSALVSYGNVFGTAILVGLLVLKNGIICAVVGGIILFSEWFGPKEDLEGQKQGGTGGTGGAGRTGTRRKWVLLIGLIIVLLGLVMLGGGAYGAVQNVGRVNASRKGRFCYEDALLLMEWGIGLSAPGIVADMTYAVFLRFKAAEEGRNGPKPATEAYERLHISFCAAEDFPQAIAQAILWVKGLALTTTTDFLISAAPAYYGISIVVLRLSLNRLRRTQEQESNTVASP